MYKKLLTIPIDEYRSDGEARSWDLPAWGHPLAYGVFPLFMSFSSRLIPIGTAFSVGTNVKFIISAAHNVVEAFRHEGRLQHLLTSPSLPSAVDLKEVNFSLLYPHIKDGEHQPDKLTLWPLETFHGPRPTDLVVGFPKFQSNMPTLSFPLSFEVPSLGEKLWSVGYTDFSPAEGFDMNDVLANRINWHEEYSHKFRVVEGFVEVAFTQRFSSSYLDGPCFSIDAEIFHGQSGGPTIDREGRIRGINSAGASAFFGKPTSLISLLAPLLFVNVKSGINLGPNFRFDYTQSFLEWIGRGEVRTDGSELRIAFKQGQAITSMSCVLADEKLPVFDDFQGFQTNTPAKRESGFIFKLKMAAKGEEG